VQVASKIVKAGPDNATVYMKGMGIMYKEHDILVEVNNDGSGVICECPQICGHIQYPIMFCNCTSLPCSMIPPLSSQDASSIAALVICPHASTGEHLRADAQAVSQCYSTLRLLQAHAWHLQKAGRPQHFQADSSDRSRDTLSSMGTRACGLSGNTLLVRTRLAACSDDRWGGHEAEQRLVRGQLDVQLPDWRQRDRVVAAVPPSAWKHC